MQHRQIQLCGRNVLRFDIKCNSMHCTYVSIASTYCAPARSKQIECIYLIEARIERH